MASSSSSSLLLLISMLAVLPFLSSARPCKTLFFISSENIQISTTSSSSSGVVDPNSARFFAVYRVMFPFRRSDGGPHHDFPRPYHHLNHPSMVVPTEGEDEGFLGMNASSLQEWARDILVVVAGILFGVGCGAITAATIYLAWSLLTNQYHACGSHDNGDDEDDFEEYASDPNKLGYVKVAYVETESKTTVPPVAKEGYEG